MERVSTIAMRLKEYRTKYDLTLADMEKIVKIPAQTLNRYELGQRAPKIDIAVQVAEQLGINPLWLQGYDVPEVEKAPTQNGGHSKDPDIRRIERAKAKMPESEWKKQMNVIAASFGDYFSDNYEDDDVDE